MKVLHTAIASAIVVLSGLTNPASATVHLYCDCDMYVTNPCKCVREDNNNDDTLFSGTDSGDYKVAASDSKTVEVKCDNDYAYAYGIVVTKDNKHIHCDDEVIDGQTASMKCKNNDSFSSHKFHVDSYKCGQYNVLGYWKEVKIILNAPEEVDLTYGVADFTVTTVNHTTWSEGALTAAEQGIELLGPTADTSILGASKSLIVLSHDEQYWDMTTEGTFNKTYDSGEDDNGKAIFQWQYDVSDPWGETITALTKTTALSKVSLPPLCVGSHSTDGDAYQTCASGYELPTTSRRRFLRASRQ